MSDLAKALQAGLNSWSDEETPQIEEKGQGKKGGRQAKKKVRVPIKSATERPTATPSEGPVPSKEEMCVRVQVTGAGRKGKKVTVVSGLESLPPSDAKALLTRLKTAISVGGKRTEEGELEVQGEDAERVVDLLKKEGFKDVKAAGGGGKKKKN